MKKLIRLLLLCCVSWGLLFASSSSFANQGDRTCTPINMINTASQKPCGEGYSGLMFKRTIVTCPDGKVTQSPDYDRSQCVPNTGNGGYVNPCIANPALCMGKPQVLGCPPGKHWTMEGLPYAHCVSDDPVCGWGESLRKNAIGEPIGCFPNTCPSNQVLQADGISCACPPGDVWNGAMCITPIVTCPADNTTYSSCPAGQSGQVETTTTYAVVNGACQAFTTVDTSNCNAVVTPPTCPQDTSEAVSCSAGYSGQAYKNTSYSVVNGACQPSISIDNSGCVKDPIPCPSDSSSSSACPAGQSGSIVTTTSYSLVNGSCQASTSVSNTCASISCPSDSSSSSACPGGQSGSIVTTTTYSVVNGSCQANTSVSNSCIACVNSTTTETQSCPAGQTGSQTRQATTNSCTGATSYTSWDSSGCKPAPSPITYTLWEFWSFDSVDPSRCSFQSWLLGYQNGVKVSEEMQAFAPGFVDNSAGGMCVLY